MWCVADLDAEYLFRKMEDVLAVYEKPYRTANPGGKLSRCRGSRFRQSA